MFTFWTFFNRHRDLELAKRNRVNWVIQHFIWINNPKSDIPLKGKVTKEMKKYLEKNLSDKLLNILARQGYIAECDETNEDLLDRWICDHK